MGRRRPTPSTRLRSSQIQRYLAIAPIFVLLLLFAGAAGYKASMAVAPPIYDAGSFFGKLLSVGRALDRGNWASLLSVGPVTRPPGWLPCYWILGLAKQPFSFRGFFAISSILPVLLWTGALWYAVPIKTGSLRLSWYRTAFVCSLCLLPMFLQFEFDPTIASGMSWGLYGLPLEWVAGVSLTPYWGMQDSALAATAGLAVALLGASLQSRSTVRGLIGFALAGYSIFVKPAGMLVIAACLGVWIVEGVVRWWCSREQRGVFARFFVPVSIGGVALQLLCVLVAFSSPYLSARIVKDAVTASAVLIELTGSVGALPKIAEALRASLGVAWATVLVTIVPLAALCLARRKPPYFLVALVRLLSAGAILGAALFWWLSMAGPMPRYLYPFMCIGVVLSVPALWLSMCRLLQPRRRTIVASTLFLVAAGQAALVVSPWRVPNQLQWPLGMSLSTGNHQDAVSAAEFIVAASRSRSGPVVYFQADMDERLAVVSAWLQLENRARGPRFKVEEPFSWTSDRVLSRLRATSGHFIVRDGSRYGPLPPAGAEIASFEAELTLLNSWLCTLADSSSVRVNAFGSIEVIEVVDQQGLVAEFDKLVFESGYRWRTRFMSQNYPALGGH